MTPLQNEQLSAMQRGMEYYFMGVQYADYTLRSKSEVFSKGSTRQVCLEYIVNGGSPIYRIFTRGTDGLYVSADGWFIPELEKDRKKDKRQERFIRTNPINTTYITSDAELAKKMFGAVLKLKIHSKGKALYELAQSSLLKQEEI